VTKRSNRTRGTRSDRMRYDLKAKAIQGGTNRTRGSIPAQVPVFIINPEDIFVDEFGSDSFFAEAESPDNPPSPILGYQWQYEDGGQWIDIVDGPGPQGTIASGAQTQTLTLTNISGNADGVKVRCAATNKYGTGYSTPATINVTNAVYFIITELGDSVIDEPAINFVVDERSI